MSYELICFPPSVFCPLPFALCTLLLTLSPSHLLSFHSVLSPQSFSLCPLPHALCPLLPTFPPSILSLSPLPSALCPMLSAFCLLFSVLCPLTSALCSLPSAFFFSPLSSGYRISASAATTVSISFLEMTSGGRNRMTVAPASNAITPFSISFCT